VRNRRARVAAGLPPREQIAPHAAAPAPPPSDNMNGMATEEELKKALKAFKKRLKLTQLDDDSKLGHSPLTGAKSKVVSIQPPAGFGKEIWEELAEKGYLKRDGMGFYELVPGK
jgi:hypothetical protein